MDDAILAVVQELPGQLSDKEVVCVLQGVPGYPTCAAYGRLAGASFAGLRSAIAALVAAGRLAYRNRALVPASPAAASTQFGRIDNTILRCLAHVPFGVGRTGLAKILKGAAGSPVGPDRCPEYAALGHLTLKNIEAAITKLIERGYLARKENGLRPLLALTEQGNAVLKDET